MPDSELPRLRSLEWYKDGKPLPQPGASIVVVAEEGDEIIGFWVSQAHIHAEPVWVREDRRGGVVGGRMAKVMRGLLKSEGVGGCYLHTADPAVAGYMGRLGMVESLDARLFFWEV